MKSDNNKIAIPVNWEGRDHQGNRKKPNLIQPQPMVVPIERIHPYDRNPRQGTNPEYDSIKDSIRTMGRDQPLTIT